MGQVQTDPGLHSTWIGLGGAGQESFNGKLRDELLDREVFYTLREAQVLVERYRQTYNKIRPHSSLGYLPPAPEATSIQTLTPALVGPS